MYNTENIDGKRASGFIEHEIFKNIQFSDISTLNILDDFLKDPKNIQALALNLSNLSEPDDIEDKEAQKKYEQEKSNLFKEKKEFYFRLVNYILELVRSSKVEISSNNDPIKIMTLLDFPIQGEGFTLGFCLAHDNKTISLAAMGFGVKSKELVHAFSHNKRSNGLLILHSLPDLGENSKAIISNLTTLGVLLRQFKIKSSSLLLVTNENPDASNRIAAFWTNLARSIVKFRILFRNKHTREEDLFQEYNEFREVYSIEA